MVREDPQKTEEANFEERCILSSFWVLILNILVSVFLRQRQNTHVSCFKKVFREYIKDCLGRRGAAASGFDLAGVNRRSKEKDVPLERHLSQQAQKSPKSNTLETRGQVLNQEVQKKALCAS